MKNKGYRPSPEFVGFLFGAALLSIAFVTIPHAALSLAKVPGGLPPFPVSVDPKAKTIEGEAPLSYSGTSLVAAAAVGLRDGSALLAAAIMSTKTYQTLDPLPQPVAVRVLPGMRKEQVADILDQRLGWTTEQRAAFLTRVGEGEGRLYPSVYLFEASTTPAEAVAQIESRFLERVGSRYSTTTEALVPMVDALTIASIIEREAGDESEMPIIAGILWNRLFKNMKLQADSTLSYARGTGKNGWWPVPRSRDKYIKSPFNTYQNEGLPPAPIASPSVASVYAALNPAKTDCLFFFHAKGSFYCSPTYEEHVKKLKKIYGRGR